MRLAGHDCWRVISQLQIVLNEHDGRKTARSGVDRLTTAYVGTGGFSKLLGKFLCSGSLTDSVYTTSALHQPTCSAM